MPLPKTWSLNEVLTSADLNAQFVYVNSLVPVGTCLAFFDYNGTCTFDSAVFKYMNGQTVSDANSPLNGQVLTDMSNRYLVGFGTEAGANIGSAAWSVTPLGRASHLVTLTTNELPAHSHGITDPTHRHSIQNGAVVVAGSSISLGSGSFPFGSVYVTGYASTGITINNSGSGNAFSIQVRSIPCRWIIRYK
jgi:hypothetical protein